MNENHIEIPPPLATLCCDMIRDFEEVAFWNNAIHNDTVMDYMSRLRDMLQKYGIICEQAAQDENTR